MINLFPPGGVANPESIAQDPMKFEETQKLRERQLHRYAGDSDQVQSKEALFVAFAQTYYSVEHLDDVALFYDFIEWDEMKAMIMSGSYPVPDVTSANGAHLAQKFLRDPDIL